MKALNEFQGLLKDLRHFQKEEEALPMPKLKPVVKIEGIKKETSFSEDKELGKHLHHANEKLSSFAKVFAQQGNVAANMYRDVTTALKKTNVALVRVKALHKTFEGKYKPQISSRIIKKLLKDIDVLENAADFIEEPEDNVLKIIRRVQEKQNLTPQKMAELLQNNPEIRIMVGTAKRQFELFWDTLKEFQSLLQDLEFLKESRGKKTASVEEHQTSD
jgi:hypothetical protein